MEATTTTESHHTMDRINFTDGMIGEHDRTDLLDGWVVCYKADPERIKRPTFIKVIAYPAHVIDSIEFGAAT